MNMKNYTRLSEEKTDSEKQWDSVKKWIKSNFSSVSVTSDSVRINEIEPGFDAVLFENGTGYIAEKGSGVMPTHQSWSLDVNSPTPVLKIGKGDYTPGSPEYEKRETQREKMSQVDRWEVIDYIQIVLDFLGFIPGFGDIIDLINALIYFYREKYVDGALSLVAIIPVVGSFMKFGLKGAFKSMTAGMDGAKIIKKALAGDPLAWQKFLEKALKDGHITKDQLAKMANYGDYASKLLKATPRKLRKWESELKYAGIEPAVLYKQFDEWANYLETIYDTQGAVNKTTKLTKAVDKIKKTAKTLPGKLVVGTVKLPFKVVDKALNIITVGSWSFSKNLLKSVFGIKSAKVSKLAKAMPVMYARKLQASPMLAAQMLKSNVRTPSELLKYVKSPTGKRLYDLPVGDLHYELNMLKQTDPKAYKQVVEQIANQSANSINPHYRMFVMDNLQTAYNIARPGAVFKGTVKGEEGSLPIVNFFKEMKFGVKSWDVISNEVQDVAERFGFDETDDPNGVIVPALYQGIMWMSGDSTRKESDTTQTDPSLIIPDTQFNELKGIYDSTEGTSTDKLSAVSNTGLDSLQMWAFQKLLGL